MSLKNKEPLKVPSAVDKNVEDSAADEYGDEFVADEYDVDAIIDLIGYSKFNMIPFLFVLSNMVITVSNLMIISYSVWIPPDYIRVVCNGDGEGGGGGGEGGGGSREKKALDINYNTR